MSESWVESYGGFKVLKSVAGFKFLGPVDCR